MRTSNILLLSSATASLVLAVHLPRLRAGIPHHRDIVRRLDLKAPSSDGDIGFVQVGPNAAGSGATTTPTATPTSLTITPTKDSAAQWLSFDASGTSVPVAEAVNLVASGGEPSAVGSGSGNRTSAGSALNDVQGAQSITTQQQQQQQPPPTSSPPVPSQQSGGLGPVSQEDADRWVKAHIEARKAHGAGKLKWREDLSWGAKTNAERCQKGHTSTGENIASSSSGMSPESAVGAWVENAALFRGIYEEQTAHYSQVVWKASQYLGCFIQECEPGTRYGAEYGRSWVATCRYDPAGNNVAGTEMTDNVQ